MVQQDTQERHTMIDEKVLFSVTFGTETHNSEDPCAEILLNDRVVVPKQSIQDNQKIDFEVVLKKDITYELVIDRSNHDERNTQILSIKKFEADDIDLNKILDDVYFYPKYPALWHKQQTEAGNFWPEKQKGWRSWGFNGRWIMNFKSPFYTWLLANT